MKIHNFYRIRAQSQVKALFTLEIMPGVLIWGCRLVESPTSKNLFADMPKRTYQHDGKTKWEPVVEITDPKILNEITILAREMFS